VISGLAPEALEGLPTPTHAFIGGSSGNMKEILEVLMEKNPKIRVVINTIALESISETLACIKELPVKDVDIVSVNIAKSRTLGRYHMMTGLNPIYIVSFTADKES
jgi:precorrin-6Y C5,15-methyltransferase (decarboxylating)